MSEVFPSLQPMEFQPPILDRLQDSFGPLDEADVRELEADLGVKLASACHRGTTASRCFMRPDTWTRLNRQFADDLAIAGRAITVARATPSEEEIAAAAESLGCEFDSEYAAFLKRYGGAMVGSLPVFGLRPVEVMGIVWSVVDVTRRYRDQKWPGTADWYVISEDGFGNPIGIDAHGKVMVSDHDHGDIAMLAANFEVFLLMQCDGISLE
jgi:hypothetical protein